MNYKYVISAWRGDDFLFVVEVCGPTEAKNLFTAIKIGGKSAVGLPDHVICMEASTCVTCGLRASASAIKEFGFEEKEFDGFAHLRARRS